MKRIFSYLSIIIIAFAYIACERDEDKVVIADPATPGSMLDLSKPSYILLLDSAAKKFETFEWTAADFGFDASITYRVEVDVKDSAFKHPATVTSVNSGFVSSINIGDFNKILLAKKLAPEVPVVMQFRVAAVVSPYADPAYSNIVEATVSPYQVDFPPLFIYGTATGTRDSIEVRSTAPKMYYTVAYLTGNESFRFFKEPNTSSDFYSYPSFTGFISDSLVNAGDADGSIRVNVATGYYAISVNLKTMTLDFDKVSEPVLYMTGQALGGWDWVTNYVQLTWVSYGKFEAETNFASNESFRFFAQPDWSPTSYNYPFFETVDALLVNADDGDKNFKFIGTTGMYKITANFLDKTVTMEEASGK